MLFFVALLVGVAVSDDTTMSQPYVQAPRVFTSIQLNSEGVQRRDLEDIDDGAGAGLVEVDKVQSDIFDHVGQKFVRKALDVLDQRLLKAAEAKRKGVDDDDDDGDDDEDVEDDAVEEEGHKDNMVLEGLHVDNDGNDENLKNDQHHDFERIEEPSLKRRRKQKRSNKEDADLMNALIKYPESDSDMNKAIQPPLRRQNSMKGNKLGSSKQRHHQFEDEAADKDELLSNAGAHKKRPAMTAQPMVPVDLNVNEGVEGGDVVVPKMDDNGLLDLASAYEEIEENSNFQTPHLGMVGSAAAGVGLIGSAAYCCISRRRSRKHHSSRSELPMYEPDSPPSNTASSTPDGYRVRRGLTKYR